MNNPLLKKLLPHGIAIVLFIIVSLLFCKPVTEGNVMNQHDTVGWQGMAQNAFEYKAKHGHMPLWNTNLFSGMPNYQVAMEGKSIMPDTVKLLSLGLPKPVNFFFLACLFFYLLSIVLRVHPVVGMLGAIAYSFATYNPVIIAAGHDTQMLATAFIPLVLAGLISIYEKKYWLGFALTTFGAYQQVSVNHLQVTYYLFLIAAFITIGYLVKWIKEKDWKHIGIAGGITVVAAIIGLASNALTLKTTSEYSKFTMRGGKDLEISGDSVTATKTKGLDTAYAFEYSLGKAEALTLLMPNAFGGGSYAHYSSGSKLADKLSEKGFNGDQIATSPGIKYWGKIFTAGPQYLGVFIFLLGILGFVIVKTPLRWGLLAATILGIFMTWGKNFAGFNVFLFENLPLYNKFRAPSFAQVIPQVTLGIMAMLTLQQLLFADKSKEFLTKHFKPILYTMGGVFLLLALVYIGQQYSLETEKEYMNDEQGRQFLSVIKGERKAVFGGQILRALGLALLGAGVIYAYVKNWLKPMVAGIILFVISSLDITMTSYNYFNNDNDQYADRPDAAKLFISKDEFTNSNFSTTEIDQQILKDNSPHYRVFNTMGTSSGSPFAESRTSYYHRSVGGYHPAKLRIYQDIIEMYLMSGRPAPGVLNMLNTKYVIQGDPQKRQPMLGTNPYAYGPCWLVSNVQVVENNVAAIKAIGVANLRDTAIIEKDAANGLVQPQRDSAAYIRLTKFDNDHMEYEADGKGPQFAVFSEIYYPKGWNAYIDGKLAPYVKTNYVLRGLSIPAGKHKVEFIFEPASVKQGRNIMFISSILVVLALVGGLFMAWKTSKAK